MAIDTKTVLALLFVLPGIFALPEPKKTSICVPSTVTLPGTTITDPGFTTTISIPGTTITQPPVTVTVPRTIITKTLTLSVPL